MSQSEGGVVVPVSACLGAYAPRVAVALAELERARVVDRIWARDHTVWRPEPTEIANRLGWLEAPVEMRAQLPALAALAAGARADGLTHALLLGMGGSSLAPELFARAWPHAGGLRLAVVDTTAPDAVRARVEATDPARTLHIVATKSGGTVETFSLMRYCYRRAADALGPAEAGRRFLAVTDPGSALAELAARLGFRGTLTSDPDVGGRFAALSLYGLAPAALVGVDVAALLDRADGMRVRTRSAVAARDNPAALLGVTMAECARAGRDKLTLVVTPALPGLAEWIEQLLAESTGKERVGIVPVVGEPLGPPAHYGSDRLFVRVRLGDGDEAGDGEDAAWGALGNAGQPLVEVVAGDRADLGGQFLLWELATAIAGHRLGIQPFDQPDVEAAKAAARRAVTEFRDRGALPRRAPDLVADGVQVTGALGGASTPAGALAAFLDGLVPGRGVFVGLQAFVPPRAATDAALARLRAAIRMQAGVAVTVGYGPRFLHSTGQLHKGGAPGARFVQLTCDPAADLPIPDDLSAPASTLTFGTLIAAQAMGDAEALQAAGRPVLALHLTDDVPGRLVALADTLAARPSAPGERRE